jgi:hypothetical protein
MIYESKEKERIRLQEEFNTVRRDHEKGGGAILNIILIVESRE